MTLDSLGVPVRAQEASQLADLIFQFAEGRAVDDGLRRMLAARAAPALFESMEVFWGSLTADPVAKSTYFVAVDAANPYLLHISLASSPASGFFPHSILVGRVRTPRGLEAVVNAIPFGPGEAARIRTLACELDRTLLPGPQGVESLFLAADNDPNAAFAQFRTVQRKYGLSVAAWTGPAEEGLWGAIRYGWRDGFALGGMSDLCSRQTIDAAELTPEEAAVRVDQLRRLHGRNFDIDILFDPPGSLTRPDALKDRLHRLRDSGGSVQVVFVEIGLRADAPYPAKLAEMAGWPDDILSNVQWKAAGKPLVELRQRVEDLQQTARQFGALIGITGYGTLTEEVLEAIGMGAARRLWFQLGGGLASSRIAELAASLRG